MASCFKTLVYLNKPTFYKVCLSTEMSTEAILMAEYHDKGLLNFLKPSENLVLLRTSEGAEMIFIVLVVLVKLGSW